VYSFLWGAPFDSVLFEVLDDRYASARLTDAPECEVLRLTDQEIAGTGM
jgi:hypothetical protein